MFNRKKKELKIILAVEMKLISDVGVSRAKKTVWNSVCNV